MIDTAVTNLSNQLSGFWHWWSGEISDMIPQKIKEVTKSRNRLDIFLGPGSVTVEAVTDGQGNLFEEERPIEALDTASWEEIAHFCADKSARLFLHSADLLSVDINLPRKAAANLGEAVRLQLPLRSPILPDTSAWAFRRLGESEAGLDIRVILAKAARLDVIELLFAEHGLMPPKIAAMDDGEVVELRSPLILSDGLLPSTRSRATAAAIALILSIPVTTILGANYLTSTNDARTAQMEAAAAPILRSWREAHAVGESAGRIAPLARTPSAVASLEEISQILPDNVWVISAAGGGNDALQLRVDAPQNFDIAGKLSQSSLIARADIANRTPNEAGRVHYELQVSLR